MQDVKKNERVRATLDAIEAEDQRKIADMLASWMAFKSRFRIHRPERHRHSEDVVYCGPCGYVARNHLKGNTNDQ
jgi:hypothetical protein